MLEQNNNFSIQKDHLVIKTNNRLNAEVELLTAIINAVGDAIIATDTKGHIISLNPVAEKLTGFKQAESVGQPLQVVLSVLDTENHQDLLNSLFDLSATESPLPSKAVLISKDRNKSLITVTCTSIFNQNNVFLGKVLVIRDVVHQFDEPTFLNKGEDIYLATFENTSVGIAHVSPNGKLLRINKQFCQMLGYSVTELLFTQFQDITYPDDLVENLANYESLLSGNANSFGMEKRYIRKDQSILWVDLNVGCTRHANQEIDYFVAIVDDISVRKNAIEESSRFFTLSQEILCTAGFDGYFKKINDAGVTTLGYSADELLAKPFVEFVHPDDRIRTLAEIENLNPGKNTQIFENRYCCKDGSVRWLLWSIVTLLDEQLFYCSARDITERKKIEQDLQIKTQQFECLIKEAPFGIYLMDEELTIQLVNPYALPSFGDIPDLIGRKLNDVMHMIWSTPKAKEIINQFRHTLETGQSNVIAEMIEQRLDSQIIEYYTWEIHRIPLSNLKYGVVCYFQDISERVLNQQKVRDSEWRLRYAAESARLTYVDIDVIKGRAFTPENFADVMGYNAPSEQELDISIGINALLKHVVPEDQFLVQTAFNKLFSGQQIGNIDYRVLGDDHIVRWIESNWSSELNQDGQPIKTFATNLDITERKSVEVKMLMSQQQLSLIAQTVPVFILHLDMQLRILFANDHYLERLSKSRDEAFGQNLKDLLGQTNFERIFPYLSKAINGESQVYEVQMFYQTVGKRDMLVKHMPVRDNFGQLASIVSIVEDITIYRQYQNALLASEDRYRTLFNYMDEGYCVVEMIFDAAQNPIDFRFLEVNPPFEIQSGLVNVTGKRILEIIPNFDYLLIAKYGQVSLTGEPNRFEFEVKALERWFDFYVFRIEYLEGNKIAILFNNINARKKTEQALIASEERLQAFVMSSSDMIYSMNADWTELQQLDRKNFIKNSKIYNSNWLENNIYQDDQIEVF